MESLIKWLKISVKWRTHILTETAVSSLKSLVLIIVGDDDASTIAPKPYPFTVCRGWNG